MDKLKVAIVGIGWWSDVLATVLEKSPHLALTACYSRSPQKVAAFARKFGCEPAGSLRELVSREDVEGVILTTPNSQHREGVEAAAAAGKHVFVEKPIANDLVDAYAIVEACRRAGVICVRERRQPEVDGPEAIQSLSVVLAAIESAASERTIAVGHKHQQ
ncbi:MAG: Gfo/Idh/MocA family oxidoreductase [Candidatus Korobacteraceae bacterium]|jgi:predicted dehydrogenase